jgi:hypothetical protein
LIRLSLERFEPDLLPESSVSVQIVLGEIAGAILLEQRFIIQVDKADPRQSC